MWIGGIFCDLTKAFDYINHNILLPKLEFYGITDKANNLIKSYLNDRYQRVIIRNNYSKNCLSDWRKVKQGVPQGSILGPLFFLLYRVSQEERTKLREGVPYVKLYRYNSKHLYPKLNSYRDNGKRSLKL